MQVNAGKVTPKAMMASYNMSIIALTINSTLHKLRS
jgi:hypothetical protein